MSGPISFTIGNFSEQLIDPTPRVSHAAYSAVMHVDGQVLQWKKALRPEFMPPIATLRSEAWLAFLQMIAERR